MTLNGNKNPRGHVWLPGPDGDIDYVGDPHTGRECARCGDSQCILCHPKFVTEDCPAFSGATPA